MQTGLEQASERTELLAHHAANNRRLSAPGQSDEVASVIGSLVDKEEQALSGTTIGERLPYNDYRTIDWLHDLVRTIFPMFGR